MPVPSGVTGAMRADAIGCYPAGCTIYGTTPIGGHYQVFQQTYSLAGNTATLLGERGFEHREQRVVRVLLVGGCLRRCGR